VELVPEPAVFIAEAPYSSGEGLDLGPSRVDPVVELPEGLQILCLAAL